MPEISSSELRTRLAEALRSAESGERVVITRHGKPAAVLTGVGQPASGDDPPAEAATSERDAGGDPTADSAAAAGEPTPEELLARALAPSLRRIELDLERLPARLKPVLVLICENLLQPRLTVDRIKRVLGVGANDLTTRFHAAAGAPIRQYREDRRLEAACRLLVDTRLDVEAIAVLLGYPGAEGLGRAFKRRHGVRPPVYREFRGRLSPEALEAAQPGRAPAVPRYVAGRSAVAPGVPCACCDAALEPGAAMRAFRDLAPICEPCAREQAPELAAALEAAEAD